MDGAPSGRRPVTPIRLPSGIRPRGGRGSAPRRLQRYSLPWRHLGLHPTQRNLVFSPCSCPTFSALRRANGLRINPRPVHLVRGQRPKWTEWLQPSSRGHVDVPLEFQSLDSTVREGGTRRPRLSDLFIRSDFGAGLPHRRIRRQCNLKRSMGVQRHKRHLAQHDPRTFSTAPVRSRRWILLHSRGGPRRGSLVDLRLSGIAPSQALCWTNIVFSQVSANTKYPRDSM